MGSRGLPLRELWSGRKQVERMVIAKLARLLGLGCLCLVDARLVSPPTLRQETLGRGLFDSDGVRTRY